MDRRDFLRTGLLLSATALSLAACTTTPTEETMPSTAPAPGPTPEPTSGNRVLLAYFSRPGRELLLRRPHRPRDRQHPGRRRDDRRGDHRRQLSDRSRRPVLRRLRADRRPQRPGRERQRPPRDREPTPGCLAVRHRSARLPGMERADPDDHADLRRERRPRREDPAPFVTFAVSGMGRVRSDYTDLLPETTVTEGLAVQGEEAQQARGDVDTWLQQIGLVPA